MVRWRPFIICRDWVRSYCFDQQNDRFQENYLKKLRKLGIQVELNNILNPALVTIHYLQKYHPGANVYVIGEDILKNESLDNGIRFASSPEETDVVVVSWDRIFTTAILILHIRRLNGAPM